LHKNIVIVIAIQLQKRNLEENENCTLGILVIYQFLDRQRHFIFSWYLIY